MDLARFHFAIEQICTDIEDSGVVTDFQSLIQHLNNVAGNPGQPQHVDAFRKQLDVLRSKLNESGLNSPSYEISEVLEMLDLRGLVGAKLFESLSKVLAENQLSPQSASAAVTQFHQNLVEKIKQMNAVNDAFTELEVPYEGKQSGESEMELRLPAQQNAKSLDDLAKEAKDWHRDLSTISEVFDENRSEVKVRTLATGSWVIYLMSTPYVIYGVAKSIRGINEILVGLLTTKRLIKELVGAGNPTEVIAPLEQHAESKVKTDLEKLAAELVDEYYKGNDEGRRQELKTALGQSLKRLARKLSEGTKVNLRITPPKKPKIAEDSEPTDVQKHQIEEADAVQLLTEQVKQDLDSMQSLESDIPILQSLPAPDDVTENES